MIKPKSRYAFSLIEILVVLAMLSILMMLIAPAGVKVVERVNNYIAKKNDQKMVDKLQFQAFLEVAERNASAHTILQKFDIERITSKGLIVKKDSTFE